MDLEAPEILVSGDRARVLRAGEPVHELPLGVLLRAVAGALETQPRCGILPQGVRLWIERGLHVGVGIEIPPHVRRVRWRAESGADADSGYYRLAFPWIVLLAVLQDGAPVGLQQLYYRRDSLDTGEDLLLPKLFNVLSRNGFQCWLCFENLKAVRPLSWPAKIAALGEHALSGGFNPHAEENGMVSQWTRQPDVDPRLADVAAWQAATRDDPLFPLGVAWRDAGTTATRELVRMLDASRPQRRPETAKDLAALAAAARLNVL